MFQATKTDKQDTQKLVRTINKAISDSPVPESDLDYLFDRLWPDLETKLKTLPPSRVSSTRRSPDDMVTELLEIARGEVNYREAIQTQISRIQNHLQYLQYAPAVGWATTLSSLAGSGTVSFAPGSGKTGSIAAGALEDEEKDEQTLVEEAAALKERKAKAEAINAINKAAQRIKKSKEQK